MTWVKTVGYTESTGRLRAVYDEVRADDPEPDPLYQAHGLRPETVAASDALYRAVLHCADNTIEPWLGELVSAYTAHLLGSRYATFHHRNNFVAHVGDDARAEAIWDATIGGGSHPDLDSRALAFLRYARQLTLSPGRIAAADLDPMREAGATDAEIVEVNQICASFNYFARTLSGLGVEPADPRDTG